MRGQPQSMRVLQPKTVRAALATYDEYPQASPLAGGTDLIVGWNAGLCNHRSILDLSRLTAWKQIRARGLEWVIGSLVTHDQLRRHPTISKKFPMLSEACATVGGRQIQNRGTLGGNLANASPAGDSFPPLLVYDAQVQLRSSNSKRSIPVGELFTGVKQTALARSELIESVTLALPKRRPTTALFRKVGTRAASAISKTVMAGLVWKRPDGRIRELRVAFGSMAPTARRLTRVEAWMHDKKATKRVVDDAVELLTEELSPIDDLRSTRDYRMQVSQNLLRDLLRR